jgi:hypothetical protein
MSNAQPSPPADLHSSSGDSFLPTAWQPLTLRGVAAFSRASLGRLLLVQSVVALLVVASVIWFLATVWFPTTRAAIRQLPATGLIQEQQLSTPRSTTEPLAENRFLAFVVNADGIATANLATDLRIEFRRRNFALCSLLGCLRIDYPKDSTVQFNRPDLESWWAAWEPTIYSMAAIALFLGLFASWLVLATLYAPVARLYAFFKDRHLTVPGSWKLASAALMPGALLASAAIVLYGLVLIDLLQFLILWVLHLPVGWVYLFASPLRLPRVSEAPLAQRNPFGKPGATDANPFSSEKE